MERNRRTSLQGVVVSNKMNKTIVVEVETHKRHAKYQKRVKYSNRYYAHDENNVANIGDTVTIMACRPLSATKRFRLVSVDKKALASIKASEAEARLEAKEGVEEVKAEVKKVEKEVEVAKEEAKVEEAPKEEKAASKKPAIKKTATKKVSVAKEEEKAPAKKASAKKVAKKEE